MNTAQETMRQLNRNALFGQENGLDIMIEDYTDPDGRIYRIEYQSTADGQHAVAFCRHNPWGNINGDTVYEESHIDRDGFVCVGTKSIRSVGDSPYSLEYVVARARYWCTAFSVLKETGAFPNPQQGNN